LQPVIKSTYVKQIDKLILKSFIGPFMATFFIALFVLTLQVLWVYIDELIGRGLGIATLSEMIFYLSVSLVPQALPIAVLISSVMVFGNLAEHYELSAFKSAGVSLFRIMMPGLLFVFGIAVFSFFSSNDFIPRARLQFVTRMYDIRQKKATLSLEEQTFNDDFKGFSIFIGSKDPDGITISDVLIYDQSNRSKYSMIAAEVGKMYNVNDGQYFVLKLFNGTRYEEAGEYKSKNKQYTRTGFKEYTKIFDLSEFDLNESNHSIFKTNEKMLNITQLYHAIDSINTAYDQQPYAYKKISVGKYYFEKKNDTTYYNIKQKKNEKDKILSHKDKKSKDKKTIQKENKKTSAKIKRKRKPKQGPNFPKHIVECPIDSYDFYLETFEISKQSGIISRAKSSVRSLKNKASNLEVQLTRIKKKKTKHIMVFYDKFSLALICLIFLFIGAPMGAIVKKGGFGFPILIAIFVFVAYMMLNIFYQKRAELDFLSPHLAAWLPSIYLSIAGIILTILALNDVSTSTIASRVKIIGPLLNIVKQKYERYTKTK